MNPNTRVSVHCYEGDEHQVRAALELYLHHECPATVISPHDSRVFIEHSGIECRFAGRREGSVRVIQVPGEPVERTVTGGQIANDRQVSQLRLLLSYPEEFFLMNDADSFCLAPQISRYLYAEPDVIWCGVAHDPQVEFYEGYPDDFPRFALQPPYFAHRRLIERMLEVAPQLTYNDKLPWIDHFMMQMAYAAKVRFQTFADHYGADLDRYPENLPLAVNAVRRLGKVFIHSAKSPLTWGPLVAARQEYAREWGVL